VKLDIVCMWEVATHMYRRLCVRVCVCPSGHIRSITVQGSASRILPLHTIITRHGFPNTPLYAPIPQRQNSQPRSRRAFNAMPLTYLWPGTVWFNASRWWVVHLPLHRPWHHQTPCSPDRSVSSVTVNDTTVNVPGGTHKTVRLLLARVIYTVPRALPCFRPIAGRAEVTEEGWSPVPVLSVILRRWNFKSVPPAGSAQWNSLERAIVSLEHSRNARCCG